MYEGGWEKGKDSEAEMARNEEDLFISVRV